MTEESVLAELAAIAATLTLFAPVQPPAPQRSRWQLSARIGAPLDAVRNAPPGAAWRIAGRLRRG